MLTAIARGFLYSAEAAARSDGGGGSSAVSAGTGRDVSVIDP